MNSQNIRLRELEEELCVTKAEATDLETQLKARAEEVQQIIINHVLLKRRATIIKQVERLSKEAQATVQQLDALNSAHQAQITVGRTA